MIRATGMLVAALAACGGDPDGTDVVGPFTGPTHRFVVDRVDLARDSASAAAVAGDLDGDGDRDNRFGLITGLLAAVDDLSIHAGEMIAAGALASTVELVADDLTDDPAAGVRYLGADGDPAVVAGGTLTGGSFRSNRAAITRVPGAAVVRLPVFTNADPLPLEVIGLELDLTPDGAGGYDAVVRGGLRQQRAREVAYAGLLQMIATEPGRHLVFARGLDTDRDGVISRAELDASLIASLVTADLQLFDGDAYAPRAPATAPDSVSFAIGLHLAPCPSGRCTPTPPTDLCRDRVVDGRETDVDCGPCQPCADGLACAAPSDCQSNACEGGRCRAATCADQVRDGLESDVDCGGACPACALGAACADDLDCTTDHCAGGTCAAAPAPRERP